MPARKPAKAAKDGQSGQGRSDDEILKKRQRVEAFVAADKFLSYLGTSLWVLGVMWFFCVENKPPVPSLHVGAGDAILGLIVSGCFCTGIAKASPRGAWSAWRKPWHLAWCPALALLAVLLGLASRTKVAAGGRALPLGALGCGLLALAAAATFPPGPPPSPSPSSGSPAVASARLLVALDGLIGLALAASTISGGLWAYPLGPVALGLTAVPVAMLSLGVLLCRSEAELLSAVPVVMLFSLGASLRAVVLSSLASALPPVAALVAHAVLYLPFPLQEPDSNPFNRGLRRSIEDFSKFMASPIAGWGDCAE